MWIRSRGSRRETLTFVRDPRQRSRSLRAGLSRGVRNILLLALAGCAAILVAWGAWGGRGRPQVETARPIEVVGRQTPVSLALRAGRTGLRSVELRIETESGTHSARRIEFPSESWLGSGVREHQLDVVLDASALGASEGPARMVVLADEHSLLSRWRGLAEVWSIPVRVDLTPPKVSPRSGATRSSRGGSGVVVYEVEADAVRSGVTIGPRFFPGRSGAIPGSSLAVALFAVPHDQEGPLGAKLMAEDVAGNRREVPLSATVKPKVFPAEDIVLTDTFLTEKIPSLLSQNGFAVPADPVEGYLLVNRELRRRTEERLRGLTRESSARFLFDAPFLQQPGTAVGSRFAEHRTYRYNGRVVDEQTHLGTDLASVKQDPVLAANAGIVIFAGDLGIYGSSVVLDHGLGLETLYAHLSQIAVAAGQQVARGETIGRSGETGLAGGDHLHFSVMIGGTHVDPVEWWDGKWIRDHVTGELTSAAEASVSVVGSANAAASATGTIPAAGASGAGAASPAGAAAGSATSQGVAGRP